MGGSQNAESEPPSAELNHDQTSEVSWFTLSDLYPAFSSLTVSNAGCWTSVFQGFICPQCMKSHNSAEELFKHYDLFHDTGELPAHVAPTR